MPMEEELETMTAMPYSLTFDGEKYELSPLNIALMAKLRKWAKEKIIEEAKDSISLIGDAAPKEVIAGIWESVTKQLGDPLVSGVMSNPETIAEWTRLSLLGSSPNMSTEKANEIIASTNLRELLQTLMDLNSVVENASTNPTKSMLKVKDQAG